jgi:four helix bundle protein
LDVIKLVEGLPSKMTSQVVGRQLLKSATSVGANYRSARRAQSKADFISKMSIAQEEADETAYWLEMAIDSGLVKKDAVGGLLREADELTAMLTSSIKTAKKRTNS